MIKQQQKDFQKDFSLIVGRKRSCRSIYFHFSGERHLKKLLVLKHANIKETFLKFKIN